MIRVFCGWMLLWLLRHWKRKDRARWLHRIRVVTFAEGADKPALFLFWRHEVFWPEEWIDGEGKTYNRAPWWRPFNALLHWWKPISTVREAWHDHPRWSITLCLRGKLIEHTPWGNRILTPGSIVFRSRKFIHAFSVPEGFSGKTWTLFIVGRRNHRQNSYTIIHR